MKGVVWMKKSKTYIAIPPGETIKEQLEDRNMSQKEFSLRMGMTEKHISKLINGEVKLTTDVSYRLEMVLGLPAIFWSKLEALYQEDLLRIRIENELDEDIEYANKFPYQDMVKLGWIEKTSKKEEKVLNLRKYFEVVNLTFLKDPQLTKNVYFRSFIKEQNDFSRMTWIQKAKIDARNIETGAINLDQLARTIPDLKQMTTGNTSDMIDELRDMMAECGVAIVFLPSLCGLDFYGATFIDGKKIILALMWNEEDIGQFWISFFHELAHILLGHIEQEEILPADEILADKFALDVLMMPEHLQYFLLQNDLSITSIKNFSKKLNINEAIALKILQKKGYIK